MPERGYLDLGSATQTDLPASGGTAVELTPAYTERGVVAVAITYLAADAYLAWGEDAAAAATAIGNGQCVRLPAGAEPIEIPCVGTHGDARKLWVRAVADAAQTDGVTYAPVRGGEM